MDDQHWQTGDVLLEHYEVIDKLGEGGMGTVYKVHHRGWNIDLAVKSPRPEIFARANGKENFIREAETWVKLSLHPHIVGCYYVRPLEEIPCIFAEYVAGGSLAEWIQSRRLYEGKHQQALERVLDVAIQFAWGLHAAHEQGLVHQDIKPANVMITLDGLVKVTDFGLAKARVVAGEHAQARGSDQQSILVSSRGMTLAYCSPEQAMGWPLSRKTDIWSWGVSVLEMFVGAVTWMHGALANEALAAYQTENPAIPPMPIDLVTLLSRCFQRSPSDRPATMLEIATELQAIYTRETGSPYARAIPSLVQSQAETLNNRALSLYDLGRGEEAMQFWERALEVDPQHPETIYNRGVTLWRQKSVTDAELLKQLEVVHVSHNQHWHASYLQALVHLERGDIDSAFVTLKEAARLAPEEKEIEQLLQQVISGAFSPGPFTHLSITHPSGVASGNLSADGSRAIFGSDDQTVQVWEIAGGQTLRPLIGHTGEVTSVYLSADGRIAISGSIDQTLRLWDVASGHCLRTFTGHTNRVIAVGLSADGRIAISGSTDQTLRLWDVASGRCLHAFPLEGGPRSRVTVVSLSPDGSLALSGHRGGSPTLSLWDVKSGHLIPLDPSPLAEVGAIGWSADGYLAYSTHPGETRVWEIPGGRCLHTFKKTTTKSPASLSADGGLVLTGNDDQAVQLWEVVGGRCLRTFPRHPGRVSSVSLSADGGVILSTSREGTVQVWKMARERIVFPLRLSRITSYADQLRTQTRVTTLVQQAHKAIEEAHFPTALDLADRLRAIPGWERSQQGAAFQAQLLPYCAKTGFSTGWLARTITHLSLAHQESPPFPKRPFDDIYMLNADGRLALSTQGIFGFKVWEVAGALCLHDYGVLRFTGSGTSIRLRSGAQVTPAPDEKGPHLIDYISGHYSPLSSFPGSEATTMCLSADGRLALFGFMSGNMLLVEVASGQTSIFKGHRDMVTSVSLSMDGHLALTGSRDGTVRLWEVIGARNFRTFTPEPRCSITSVLMSADGHFALFLGGDGTVRLWNLGSGRCWHVCGDHTDEVTSMCLSADGRLLLSGGRNGTVRLWEVSSGRCLCTCTGHTDEVTSVSLSADGRLALSGSRDGTMRLWDLSSGRCLFTVGSEGKMTTLSPEGGQAFCGDHVWELSWVLEAHQLSDWDEEARPVLEMFLSCHTPYNKGILPSDREPSEQELQQALTRQGSPAWNEEDFQGLLRWLHLAGYGWLRPEGVRRQLEQMASAWKSWPLFSGERIS